MFGPDSISKKQSENEVGLGETGLDLEGLAERLLRSWCISPQPQRIPQVEMRLRSLGS